MFRFDLSQLTGIGEAANAAPRIFELNAIYPNPFNGQTNIQLNLSEPENVSVTVYDVLGRKVSDIYDGYLTVGNHGFSWPEAGGHPNYNTGVYYYKVTTGGSSSTGRMIYLK